MGVMRAGLKDGLKRIRAALGSPNQVACSCRDEEGFTTAGMAIAILLSLALIFTAAQVYRVQSASAEIQDVADAVALAAESEVAEFMIVVRVCDAIVLSMTLLTITVYGIAVVALCIPGAQATSTKLIEVASKIIKARRTFADKATQGLNVYQQALPYIAAAQGAAVALANNRGSVADATYLGAALLIPARGETVRAGKGEKLDELQDEVESKEETLREATEAAERAAEKVQEAKLRGYQYDCGNNPSYCLYERSKTLAGLSGVKNPFFSSVDTWSFGAAMNRAKAYYRARLAQERPTSSSFEEQENSALRKIFYSYAVQEMDRGYVYDTDSSFSAYFPKLPKNTEQLRSTTLYAQAHFPITVSDGKKTMHAWPGCPNATGYYGLGSVKQLDSGSFVQCGVCNFKPSSLGSVAAASTNINNGFEYHYTAIAQAAEDYRKARDELDPVKRKAQKTAESLFDKVVEAFKSAGSSRIYASPPGRKGAISMVVNLAQTPAEGRLRTSIVAGGRTLGTRVAVSGATLVEEEADGGSSIIVSLLDGLGSRAGVVTGIGRLVLTCWSALLHFYGQGQRAILDAIESALSSLPLISACGLGKWAANALRDTLEKLGLQPANINAIKPVLINTGHIARAGTDGASKTYAEIKQRALDVSYVFTEGLSGLANLAEAQITAQIDRISSSFEIASIELPLGIARIPIVITLPSSWTDGARSQVERCFDALDSLVGAVRFDQAWR